MDALVNGRLERVRLCAKRPWCIENEHHDGPCVEVAREKHKPSDFGPKARK